jgi:hypothetical protein
MFGDFDCLNPVAVLNSGSDRAITPQKQRSITPTGPIRRVADDVSANRVSSRERRSQSCKASELKLAKDIYASSRTSNLTPGRRTSSRKKERQWENNNLIPVLQAGHKLPPEHKLEDLEGHYDDATGKFKINWDRFQMKVVPKSLFAKLFLPENADVLAEFRKCQNHRLSAMDELSHQLDAKLHTSARSSSAPSSSSSSCGGTSQMNGGGASFLQTCEKIWIANVESKLRKVVKSIISKEAQASGDPTPLTDLISAMETILIHYALTSEVPQVSSLSAQQVQALESTFHNPKKASLEQLFSSLVRLQTPRGDDDNENWVMVGPDMLSSPRVSSALGQIRCQFQVSCPLRRLLVYSVCQFYGLSYKVNTFLPPLFHIFLLMFLRFID